jgi:RHS repeat-associated protein
MMARQVTLSLPLGILSEPDGSFYVPNTDLGYGHDGVYRVQPSMPGLSGADYLIASEDGQELYLFDDQGRHYRTLDARTGLTHRQFEYDSSGLLSRLFDADNNLVVIEREVPGNIVIVAPGGQRTLLILDENGYVQEVRNLASGDRVQLTHRENGLLEHLVDWRGYDHWFEYEASTGRLVYDRDPAMGVTAKTLTRSVLPDSSAVVDFKSPLDRATRYGFEIPMTGANRNMTSASAKELVSTVTIGSDGITPALGPGMTRYTTVNPTGSRVITLVDDNGVETRNDASGTITNLERQPDPRFGMQAPYPRQIITYTPQGLVSTTTLTKTIELASPADISALLSESEIVTVNNRIYSTSFDNSTRQIVSNSPEGRVAVFTLDDKGRIASILPDSRLLPAIRHYDEKGRLDRTGQDNVFWTYVYDDNNRLHQVRSPMGDNTVYGYDNADRVNSIQLPSGRSYGFEYDASGNRTKIVMPNMAEHRLGYSPVNLDNGYTPPANPSYTHGYSLDREWKRTTLPSGRQVTATYGDNTGRLETIAWWEGNVTFGYQDNDDRVWSITRTDNTAQQFPQQVMNYDFDGSLIKKVASSGLANGEYRYIYDNNFFLTRVALDNVWNLLSRDNDGLLTGFGPFTISRGGPSGSPDNVSDLSPRDCGLDGDEQPIQCPTGWLVQSFGYDNVGRLDRRTSTINGNVVYEEMLERDPVGRISIKTETVAGTAPVIFEYFYDVDGQLDNVVRDYVLYEKYGYDLNGNRTLAHGPAAPWQDGVPFDNQDRETGASVSFDMDGNLVQRGSRNFTYSARGELLTVTDTGIPVVSYAYDGMNRRIAGTNADNQTTQYLYGNLGQPFQVTASIAPDNVLTNYFYDDFGALYALERGGVRYYVASDHLGTPKVVTDNAGNVLRVMAYDSWGVKTYDNNATFDLLVGFAGGLVDNGTNLVRFGYRDYEPQTGRWLSKDPIFHKGGLNLYQYCGNDPVNWKDPSGLWWSDKAWPWVRDKAAPAVKNFIENAVPAVLHDLVGAIYGAGTIAPEVNSAAIDAAVGRYNIEESAKENPDYIDPSWAHENPGAAYDLLLKRKKACKLKR